MKNLIYISFLMIYLIFNSTTSSQNFEGCGLSDIIPQNTTLRSINNTTSLPHTGNIKIYVIFAQFKDDTNTTQNGWTRNTYPSWANTFINSSPNGSYPWNNLSHYFNEMSNGTFQVYGDVYNHLVTTTHNENYYNSIGEVNREIIQKVDPYVDFSDYDNLNGSSPGSDGIVDFVMIIYRNATSRDWYYTAIAQLEVSQTLNVDGKQIVTSSYIGGGVQQRSGYVGRDYTMYVSAHEIGHYLFGGGHINNANNLCLMSRLPVWNGSRGMHSWEREKLGWLNYTDKSTDGSVTMTDYMTTRQVYRIPGNSNEFFLIENRKKNSPHDKAGDVGFYFYRITSGANYPPTIDVLCADGNWDFSVNTSTQKLTRTTPNVNGHDEMNFRQTSGGKTYACYTPVYHENSAWGDNEDAFDQTFNNVLSPVSNPRSNNGASLEFAIEVTGTNKITFYFDGDGTNEYAGAPSKPQNLRKNNLGSGPHPHLIWEANTEPDLKEYWLYRKTNNGSFNKIATINKTTTTYTDNSVTFTKPIWGVYTEYDYKLKAVDTQNKKSVYSNSVHYAGNVEQFPIIVDKINYNLTKLEKIDEITNYSVQNYPNPFNPSTQINYQIPKEGHVSLKVYNSLGEEVKTLVNDFKGVGSYNVEFNANNLPSGMYFYKLQSGEFSQVKKMLLVK